MSVDGIGSDPLQLSLCISLVFCSCSFFGVWHHFRPSGVMPSDPDTVCKNGAQVSRRFLSFSPTSHFGDRHASILDRPFYLVVLATLNGLSHHKKCNVSRLSFSCYPISWTSTDLFRPLDNNVAATFVSCYMVTKYVLALELVQVATWLS